MPDKDRLRYQAISKIITAPVDPQVAQTILREALANALAAIGVAAGSVVIFDKKGLISISIAEGDPELITLLNSLEQRMISSLRDQYGLENIYTTLNYSGRKSLFSYLIKLDGAKLGTISGISEGERNIALEEEFIVVLAASLRQQFGQKEMLETAQLQVLELAKVTLSHLINNPLTAVIGNVQLLLKSKAQLTPEIRQLLSKIEESGLKIEDVIDRLNRLTEVKKTSYLDGTDMLDLGEENKSGS